MCCREIVDSFTQICSWSLMFSRSLRLTESPFPLGLPSFEVEAVGNMVRTPSSVILSSSTPFEDNSSLVVSVYLCLSEVGVYCTDRSGSEVDLAVSQFCGCRKVGSPKMRLEYKVELADGDECSRLIAVPFRY